MGNKQGSLGNHLDTASKTGALAFPGKVRFLVKITPNQWFRKISIHFANYLQMFSTSLNILEIGRVSWRFK